MNKRSILTITILSLFSLFFMSCGGDDGSQELDSIAITPTDQSKVKGTDSIQFTATGSYSDGSTENITNTVTWTFEGDTTSDTSLFMSNEIKGLFYLSRVGTFSIIAKITVTLQNTTNEDKSTTKEVVGLTTLTIN